MNSYFNSTVYGEPFRLVNCQYFNHGYKCAQTLKSLDSCFIILMPIDGNYTQSKAYHK